VRTNKIFNRLCSVHLLDSVYTHHSYVPTPFRPAGNNSEHSSIDLKATYMLHIHQTIKLVKFSCFCSGYIIHACRSYRTFACESLPRRCVHCNATMITSCFFYDAVRRNHAMISALCYLPSSIDIPPMTTHSCRERLYR
jgi:hypothetical protein